jgi:hypothetical protein
MTTSNPDSHRRTLAVLSLIGMSALLLTNPLTRVLMRGGADSTGAIAASGFIAPPAMVLMIGSVFAIMHLLRERADRRGLAFGAILLMGWAVGIRIVVLGQIDALLENRVANVPVDALQKLFEAAPIVWVSIVPVGLLFPIGVISLGLTLAVAGPLPRWIGALMAIGGVLFPLGRAVHLEWAYSACDLILGTVLALIAWQILARPELWSGAHAERDEFARGAVTATA